MYSGSEDAGIMTHTPHRYIELGVYFWIDDKLFDNYVEIEGHDGIIYPVIAYPDLAEKDGITADDVVYLC